MAVGGKEDHGLVCLDVSQLLSLEVGRVVVKPPMLEVAVGVAAEITMGGVFSAVLVASLEAEGSSGVARAPQEDVTTFVVANTRA